MHNGVQVLADVKLTTNLQFITSLLLVAINKLFLACQYQIGVIAMIVCLVIFKNNTIVRTKLN